MRAFVMALVIYVNFLLQTTLFKYISIFGVKPVTVLLIVISYAILRGDVEGALVGFFAGLLQDIFFMPYIGLCALLCALTGYFCGKPFKDFFRENYMLPVLLTLVSVSVYECVFYFINFSLQGRLFYYFRSLILPETIYTMLLAIPVYRIIYGVNRRLEAREEKHRHAH